MKKDLASMLLLGFLSIGTSVFLFQCKKTSDNSNSSGASSQNPGPNEVWIQNMVFYPSSITVSVNTTVKWTNKDGAAHTVTSTSGQFDSGNIGVNGSYSYKFTTTGTFPYKCNYHGSMTGTVVVQ